MTKQNRLLSVTGWLLPAVFLLFAAGDASGQGEMPRLAFIDLDRVFEEYYKTDLAEGQLKEQEAEFRAELEKMVDQAKKVQEEFRRLREESEDRTLSETARSKKRAEAEEKLLELRDIESRARRFEESRRRQLAEQTKRTRDWLVQEIRTALNDFARRENLFAVFEVSGNTENGVPAVLYFEPMSDITDAFIKELNNPPK